MYRGHKTAVVIPAYNEANLVEKTIATLPDFIDLIFITNDASRDNTLEIIQNLARKNKKLQIIDHQTNLGVGAAVVSGLRAAVAANADLVTVMAADAQCDPSYIQPMITTLIEEKLDYVKANRFVHLAQLNQMPLFRRVGNIVITILTKFASGYYNIFDSQNGYGVFRRQTLERLNLDRLGKRYDYESTLLIELSILGARIKDESVPAIYGDEISTIPIITTAHRSLVVLRRGFWRRIYYRYVIVNFHPLALFLFSGLVLMLAGFGIGVWITFRRIWVGASPSTGTVLLSVAPLLVGFQLVLSAFMMDMNNEGRL